MKKEAVSVLKPRNGKAKSKVTKNSKKSAPKIPPAVAEPRGKPKAKIVDIQQVNIGSNALKKLKSTKVENIVEAKTQNLEKTSESEPKKIVKHAADKMAAVLKNHAETRVQPKRLKSQARSPIAAAKKPKKIVKVESAPKAPEVETEPETKPTTKRKSEVTKKPKIENVGDLKLTKKRVLRSIRAVQQLAQIKQESKKSLLPTESNPLMLQITCVKVAKTPRRQIRPYLPHQLAGPLDDVALFVPDLETGRGRDYEKTVEHWETILRDKGVSCIKEVIPINRVKTEFRQFEMQRKLAMSFDYFLVDGRIAGHMTHLLGKPFFKRKSAPTPVKLKRDNLKSELNFALHKTCMEIHPYGNTHTMPVGTLSMSEKKLAENVWAACESLAKEYPGGWANVRALRLKTNTGPAIPIYMNLVSKNDVPTPVVKPKRPRAYETVEGELTTVPGGANVKLTPEGRIHVTRLKDFGDPEAKEDDDDDDEEDEEETAVKEESEVEKDNSDED